MTDLEQENLRLQVELADINDRYQMLWMAAWMSDMKEAFNRIGHALGLEGTFLIHFGYEQIEARLAEVKAERDAAKRMLAYAAENQP